MVLPKLIASGRAPASRQAATSSQLAASKLLAEADQPLQHRPRRIGLHGVIDPRQRQRAPQRAEISSTRSTSSTRHGVAGCCCSKESGDFGRHRTGPPLLNARLNKATGGVDETVERTSDQNDCQNA